MSKKKNRRVENIKIEGKKYYDPDQTLRNFTIVTDLINPIDSSIKWIKEDIQKVIDDHIDQIRSYAWILHDKDTVHGTSYYKERMEELDPGNPLYSYYGSMKEGVVKPSHVHIVISLRSGGKKRSEIAKWFGVHFQVIRSGALEAGRHLNEGIALYLLHTNSPGKHQYDISELHCSAEIKKKLPNLIKQYEIDETISKSKTLDQILDEMQRGKTLAEVYRDPDVARQIYFKNLRLLRDAEAEYRLNEAKLPEYLLNIYIEGQSGSGKTSFAKILAKHLYPEADNPYFVVGAKSVALQNYRGEKTILWNDITTEKLLSVAPTGDIQDMLDPYQQEKIARNIKNSYVILTNEVNMFTSTIPYKEFFSSLITNDTSDVQIYRRIPMVIRIEPNKIYLLVNKGEWYGNSSLWSEYDEIDLATVSIANLMRTVPDSDLERVLSGVLNEIRLIIRKMIQRATSKNQSPAEDRFTHALGIVLTVPKSEYISFAEYEDIYRRHSDGLDYLQDMARKELNSDDEKLDQEIEYNRIMRIIMDCNKKGVEVAPEHREFVENYLKSL